jgi:hypothetical protein
MTSVRLFRKRAIEDAVTRAVSSRTVFSHLRPTLQIWARGLAGRMVFA